MRRRSHKPVKEFSTDNNIKEFDKHKQSLNSKNKQLNAAGEHSQQPLPDHPFPLLPPVSPAGPAPHPVPPHDPEQMQNEKFRARFELNSAYRDLRRGELILQQIETYLPYTAEASFSRKLLETASEIYQTAYKNYQKESFYKAAEYSAAVKDLARGIDKFYNTAGPYPIYPESEKNKTLTGGAFNGKQGKKIPEIRETMGLKRTGRRTGN